jgi:hypothetical protein
MCATGLLSNPALFVKNLPQSPMQSSEQQLSTMFSRSLFQHSTEPSLVAASTEGKLLQHMLVPYHPRLSYPVYEMPLTDPQKLEFMAAPAAVAAVDVALVEKCHYTSYARLRCGLAPGSEMTLPEVVPRLKQGAPRTPFTPVGYDAAAQAPMRRHTGLNLPLQVELALEYLDFCEVYPPEQPRRMIHDHLFTLLEPIIKPKHIDIWDMLGHKSVIYPPLSS